MHLSSLGLKHFRGYSQRTFTFSKKTTVLLGPNAVGKTNILEAIFLLAVGKSFRAEREGEMVSVGEEVGRVAAKMEGNDVTDLEVVITSGSVQGQKAPIKKYLVNGIARRVVDFAGHCKAVLFHPEDLELIHGSPNSRRKYLDFTLIQTDREYRRCLYSYEKGLRQRNKLLERIRDEGVSRSQLLFWDQLLIKNGNYLTHKREAFITAINESIKPFGQFKLRYDHSTISPSRLAQYADAEVGAAVTLVGPHRDDLQFFEQSRDISKFGSRGEQRLMVLWLKLCELHYVEASTGERPLLLLDDIFSELDHGHRDEVLSIITQQQTIVTTADRHFIPGNIKEQVEMVELP